MGLGLSLDKTNRVVAHIYPITLPAHRGNHIRTRLVPGLRDLVARAEGDSAAQEVAVDGRRESARGEVARLEPWQSRQSAGFPTVCRSHRGPGVCDESHLVGADAVCIAAGHGVDHRAALPSADAVVDVWVRLETAMDGGVYGR